jgi:hypothetical protein
MKKCTYIHHVRNDILIPILTVVVLAVETVLAELVLIVVDELSVELESVEPIENGLTQKMVINIHITSCI